ncbi:hypothetical protein [Falsiroseomonas sp.]|uniref:hypothetical protein n=1 Tax=Falsiroseomonas sp. TaxID=2870721 RepID=UPI003F717C20
MADVDLVQQHQQHAAAHAALEVQIAQLAARAPHMVVEGGPGFMIVGTVITLPGGGRLRFEGTLEIVE